MHITDLAPQLAANRAYWAGYDGADPHDDLPIYRTGIPHRLLNGVLRVRNRPIDDAVAEARKRLDGTRWVWWVGADSDPGTAAALRDRGAELTSNLPMMAADLRSFRTFPAPADLRITPVHNLRELRGYVEAGAEQLGVPTEAIEDTITHESGWSPSEGRLVRLAGQVGGRTVASTAMLVTGEVAALYWIATVPAHRGRGIATALTVEALRIARESGATIATLQASSLGEPVYRRIGFETVAHYQMFALPL